MAKLNQDMLMIMKAQSWERAKGELRGISALFMNAEDDGAEWESFNDAIEEFFDKIEDNGIGGFS